MLNSCSISMPNILGIGRLVYKFDCIVSLSQISRNIKSPAHYLFVIVHVFGCVNHMQVEEAPDRLTDNNICCIHYKKYIQNKNNKKDELKS